MVYEGSFNVKANDNTVLEEDTQPNVSVTHFTDAKKYSGHGQKPAQPIEDIDKDTLMQKIESMKAEINTYKVPNLSSNKSCLRKIQMTKKAPWKSTI